jgi:hypothetical protein
MKLTKQEWLEFIEIGNDIWNDSYIEEISISVGGTEIEDEGKEFKRLPLGTKITVGGFIANSYTGNYVRSLDAQIKLWRKQRDCSTLLIEVKKENIDAVKAAIKLAGGKIIL